MNKDLEKVFAQQALGALAKSDFAAVADISQSALDHGCTELAKLLDLVLAAVWTMEDAE